MFATCRVLLVLAMGAGLAGVPTARADDKKPAKPQPAAEPGKSIVIQIDGSKLPPDVLKQLLQLAEKPKPAVGDPVKQPPGEPTKPGAKPGVKPGEPVTKPVAGEAAKPGAKPVAGVPDKPGAKAVGLADAVAIAEKTAQGSAVRAERSAAGGQFTVDVQDVKGGVTRVTVDASGKVTGAEKQEGDGKGKKKTG